MGMPSGLWLPPLVPLAGLVRGSLCGPAPLAQRPRERTRHVLGPTRALHQDADARQTPYAGPTSGRDPPSFKLRVISFERTSGHDRAQPRARRLATFSRPSICDARSQRTADLRITATCRVSSAGAPLCLGSCRPHTVRDPSGRLCRVIHRYLAPERLCGSQSKRRRLSPDYELLIGVRSPTPELRNS